MRTIIVGGGIAGSSVAYHLAAQGENVTVIDANHEGRATDAGAGIICPWITKRNKNTMAYQLSTYGARYYKRLQQSLEVTGFSDTSYRQVGSLGVFTEEQAVEDAVLKLKEERRTSPEIGEVNKISNEEARRLFPPLSDALHALHITGGARVDGKKLQLALQKAAVHHGATWINGQAAIVIEGDEVTGIKLESGEQIEAERFVLATGAWENELNMPVQPRHAIRAQRGQIVHLRPNGMDTSEWPIVQPESSYYMLTFDDERLVVGATREDDTGFDYRLTAGGLHEVLSEAKRVIPGAYEYELLETRIGFRPIPADNKPLIGPMRAYDNVYHCNGFGATGLTMAPGAGKLLADLILGIELELDLRHFYPET
ncbi:D-amino acid dehydrogenase small subunit [Geomicrobium sp. JCM 19037]|uniref:NAD(P)/FAD-dependent oxidoreductase n=1 Tax=Geomicrobium sp. JCM 19037 TaxID=1460634 RepID=UPI00045F3DF7|nr:FAD-dependent oxidoreductase [Geomicrobium sp. JCM 19037]GAK02764.1 D-amino acid dehydrogenase small subunit [Geomicrobium sp. JCM 19037]